MGQVAEEPVADVHAAAQAGRDESGALGYPGQRTQVSLEEPRPAAPWSLTSLEQAQAAAEAPRAPGDRHQVADLAPVAAQELTGGPRR